MAPLLLESMALAGMEVLACMKVFAAGIGGRILCHRFRHDIGRQRNIRRPPIKPGRLQFGAIEFKMFLWYASRWITPEAT
ncbi:hypothetical protein DFH07DRAFT_790388 [Mycena maculata]|uniref:Uncharacterized protein n=1 Tax=Mycena maculata TaxID=230809 RepID=A0AAD7KBT3_9AGAR|nr:hypothetical protein DFH07DRAFT_790388 [Mycena maculata]